MKRLLGILLIFSLLAALVPAVSAAQSVSPSTSLSEYEWSVLLLTNRERLANGRQPLTATDFLQSACDIRAQEISESFSHTRPDGTECFTVFSEVDAPYYYAAGENIAAGQDDPEAVVAAWIESPGHHANMLDADFVHMGAGFCETTGGYFRHWVQLFFTGYGCQYTSLELLDGGSSVFPFGTSIDEMHLTAKLTCSCCGTSYLPVMAELCSGFDRSKAGTQRVSLSCFGLQTEFTVTLGTHTHAYTANVTAPTCTEQGYTTYTCSCGDSYKDNYTSALGHNYVDGVCDRCGAKDPNYKPAEPSICFSDVKGDEWFAQAVDYAVSSGLMNGMGGNRFEPDTGMTRAMLVTVLWRYAGSPVEGKNIFTDLTQDWYIPAVTWAAHNGIVGSVGDGKFDPDGNITREQMAAILYRYSNFIGADTSARTDLGSFPDANEVSSYAEEALSWAVASGLITGTQDGGKTRLDPLGNATRAQVATILMRYIESVLNGSQIAL